EITAKSAQIDALIEEKRSKDIDSKLAAMDERLKALQKANVGAKAAAIMAGAGAATSGVKSVGRYNETNFLSALVPRQKGDDDAQEFVKAVLGTSVATGTAVVPNNFVAVLVEQIAATNIYRGLFYVTNWAVGAGVDIP